MNQPLVVQQKIVLPSNNLVRFYFIEYCIDFMKTRHYILKYKAGAHTASPGLN